MKKTTLLIAVFLLIAGTSMGQESQTLTVGSNLIGVGFGPGRAYHGGGGFSPAFRLHYEHGTFKAGPGVITLGGALGYSFHSYTYRIGDNTYGGTWTSFAFGVRAAWHCSWGVPKLDTYAGAAGGVRIDGYNRKHDYEPKPDYNPANPYFGGFVGAAYYFHPNIGVFLEAGYDISHATIGLDFMF